MHKKENTKEIVLWVFPPPLHYTLQYILEMYWVYTK